MRQAMRLPYKQNGNDVASDTDALQTKHLASRAPDFVSRISYRVSFRRLLTKLLESWIAAEIIPIGIDSQEGRRHRGLAIGDAE
jgi:hypothetical protein